MKKSMKMLLSTAVWLTIIGGVQAADNFRTGGSDRQCG